MEKSACRSCGSTEGVRLYRLDKWSEEIPLCDECRKNLEADICREIEWLHKQEEKHD